jgi:hypothetical protein
MANNKSVSTVEAKPKRRNTRVAPDVPEKTYGYKVFSQAEYKKRNVLTSATVRGKLQLFYEKDKKTVVNEDLFNEGFGILMFLNLKDAVNFRGPSATIFKCELGEVREPAPKRAHRNTLNMTLRGDKARRYNYRKVLSVMKGILVVVDNWPKGTMTTNYLIPVEEVSQEEKYRNY